MLLRILVAQTLNDILANSIVAGVQRRDDVTLVSNNALRTDGLRDWLRNSGVVPDIFVLVGFEPDLENISSELLADHPSSVIVRVVIGREVVHLDWESRSIDELVTAACQLYSGRDRRNGRSVTLHVGADAPAAETIPSLTANGDGIELFERVERWLDDQLLAYVRRLTSTAGDVTGLALSRTTIEALLTRDAIQTGDDDSQSTTQPAHAAADELVGHIEQAPSHRLAAVWRGLGLTPVELQAFVLCLAPELSNKYQRAFGFLNDDLSRRHPTLSLITEILGEPLETRMSLTREGVLSRWNLWSESSAPPYADDLLRVDPALVAWLLGKDNALTGDEAIRGLVRFEPWVGANWIASPRDIDAVSQITALLRDASSSPHWIVLAGIDGSISRAVLEKAAAATRRRLMRITLAAYRDEDGTGRPDPLLRIGWMARVLDAVPVLDIRNGGDSAVATQVVRRAIDIFEDLPSPCVLIASKIADVVELVPARDQAVLRLEPSSATTTLTALTAGTKDHGLQIYAQDLERLAAAYPLPLDALERALRLAGASGALVNQPEEEQAATLAEALQAVASPDLPRLATRLAPSFKLDDVILPDDRRDQLDDIVSHVVHADQVLHDWGFGAQLPYGRGVAALFMGPSGCGKTMAARAIGHALRRWVFAVDLSRVVSKYVGDTEKHLDAVFLEAEKAGAILLFDEAESLFGARGPVKDSHDQYANFKTAYLLQRVEMFSGLAILTSNLGRNIDSAFLRRLRFIVEFPIPDAEARERIWRQCLPSNAPLSEDLDLHFLARRAELPGGSIRQITLRAAFSAAAEGSAIHMRHVLAATRAEALKIGMPRLERELGELAA
ncbi:ATP-binding protein [Paraburkholderia sp. SIMBA_054]|uniref:ATP-binding protein n=1 Tax=Paraburkholderia sp. SIMBA_054 TaxID=3085795 RepID=UPI00397BAC27